MKKKWPIIISVDVVMAVLTFQIRYGFESLSKDKPSGKSTVVALPSLDFLAKTPVLLGYTKPSF